MKLKMCILQNDHKNKINITYDDINYLLPLKYVSLCVFPNVNDNQINKITDTLLLYFDQIYSFHQGNHIVLLLNFSVFLEKKEIYRIWINSIKFCNLHIGISRIQNVEQFLEDITKNTKSTLYFEALMDLLLSMLQIKSKEIDIIRNYIQSEPKIFKFIFKAIQNDTEINAYFDHLFQYTSSLSVAFTIAFLEIAIYNLTILGTEIDSEMVRATYQFHWQRIADYNSLKHFIKDALQSFWYNEKNIENRDSDYSDAIYQSIIYIKQHYFEDISLDELAQQVNLNSSYLSFLFKKEVGTTFLQYLNNIRLENACALLKNSPNLAVESISAQVGYRTPSYFYKIFREKYGMSPNQWRKKNM